MDITGDFADPSDIYWMSDPVDQADQGDDWPADCGFAGAFTGETWAIGVLGAVDQAGGVAGESGES